MMMQPEIDETGGINTSGDLNDPVILLTRFKAFCEATDEPSGVFPEGYFGKEQDYGNKN